MPLQQTIDGLQIQSAEEIKAELEAAFRDPVTGFGAGVKVNPNTVFGQNIGIVTEREALIQNFMLRIQSEFNPATATGANLDVLASYTGTFRNPADQSISNFGRCDGTPGTIISDGSIVQNEETGDQWEIFQGPYTIGAGGNVQCFIRALETGPIEFNSGNTWSIVTGIAGWTAFVTPFSINPEDIGENIETDEALRERRRDELFVNGNDLSAIKANVLKVRGVDEVAVYENRDCTAPSPEGIPEGAIEVVVEGGDGNDIVDAIYERKPPGTEASGTIGITITDIEGNPLEIFYTPVSDVEVWVTCIVNTTGAEVGLPDNVVQLITQAIVDFGDANSAIGQDVIPDTFHGPIFEVLKDPETGKYAATSLTIEVGTTPVVGPSPVAIGIRERADYDTVRVAVAIP